MPDWEQLDVIDGDEDAADAGTGVDEQQRVINALMSNGSTAD